MFLHVYMLGVTPLLFRKEIHQPMWREIHQPMRLFLLLMPMRREIHQREWG